MTTQITRPDERAQAAISADDRQRRVAEAAYFRAQQRNFSNGDPVADWLEAERQVDSEMLSADQSEDAAAYNKLRQLLRDALSELRDMATPANIEEAFDRACEELKKTGAHTAETITRIATVLRNDMAEAADKLGPGWQALSERSANLFDVWRDRGTSFLSGAARSVGEWLQQTGAKLEQQTSRGPSKRAN